MIAARAAVCDGARRRRCYVAPALGPGAHTPARGPCAEEVCSVTELHKQSEAEELEAAVSALNSKLRLALERLLELEDELHRADRPGRRPHLRVVDDA